MELNAVVTHRIKVSPYLIILRIAPDGWPLPEFLPGQFAVVGLPGSAPRCAFSDAEDPLAEPDKLIRRAYSIASSSVDREYIELYITLVHSGALTPRLFALKLGDRVWLSSKFSGLFTLAELPEDVNVVMIATGTGLAPYMSMIRTSLECGDKRRFAILHGARHSWDLGYSSELVTMARVCANLTYLPIISRPDEEPVKWSGESGYVQDLWTRGLIDKAWGVKAEAPETHIFLCGNPMMVDEMRGTLLGAGFSEHTKKNPGEVHIERYW